MGRGREKVRSSAKKGTVAKNGPTDQATSVAMAATQRNSGDRHRVWLDRKYKKRAWKNICKEHGEQPTPDLATWTWYDLLNLGKGKGKGEAKDGKGKGKTEPDEKVKAKGRTESEKWAVLRSHRQLQKRTPQEQRSGYRRLAKEHHPDKHGDIEVFQFLQRGKHAFDV